MSKKSYLDLLHEIESGNGNGLEITDLIDIPKSSASRKAVADEMIRSIENSYGDKKEYSSYEEEIHGNQDDDTIYDEYVDESDGYSDDSNTVINDFINKCNHKGKKKKKKTGIKGIPYEMLSQASSERITDIPTVNVTYSDASGRIIVDDGAAPVSVHVMSLIDLEEEYPYSTRDSDAVVGLLANAYKFIIASKYPSVIMTRADFELNFGIIEKLDSTRFMFFTLGDYVLGYAVQPDSQKRFHKIIESYRMDIDQIYSFVSGLIAMMIDEENCFPYNDEDEFKIVLKFRSNVQQFVKTVENDPGTKFAGHNFMGNNIYDALKVIDYRKFFSYIQNEFFPYEDDETYSEDDLEETSVDDDVTDNDNIDSYIAGVINNSNDSDVEEEPVEPIVTKKKPVYQSLEKSEPEKTDSTHDESKPKTFTAKPTGGDKSFVLPVIRGNK